MFALLGWRVLDFERTERERRAARDAGVAVARGKADADRLARTPRGRPLESWRLEPFAPRTNQADPAESAYWDRLRRAAALEGQPLEALAQYEALLHPSMPTWVRDVASLRMGALLNGQKRFEESRRHLARAAEASPLLIGVSDERVRFSALGLLALDGATRGDGTALRRLLDEGEDGARLEQGGTQGAASSIRTCDMVLGKLRWKGVLPSDRRRLEDASARASRGQQLLESLGDRDLALRDDALAWRNNERLALFPLTALIEPPLPGTERGFDLVAVPDDTIPRPGALRLEPPLANVLVVPRATSEVTGLGAWLALALGLGLLAYGIGTVVAVRGWQRSQRAADQQADFTAAVSHEMKTPIASVRAMAELLADAPEGDAERTRRYGERIDREMQRLGATVRNVLDAAHIERGTLPVHPAPGDPAALLERLGRSVRPSLEARDFEFVVAVEEASDPIPFDSQAIEGVLLNLIDNAAKFSREHKSIELHGAPAPGGGYRITVLDRGVGLGSVNPNELFGRYNRGAAAREGAVPGVGLGLHIARQVVDAHGGRLTARNRPRGGAVFELVLPGISAR